MSDSHIMNCAECQSRLEEFALDELPIDVRTRVAKHLSDGCSACNLKLSEILGDFAQLAHALPIERPTMRVERQLLQRIAAERGPNDTAAPSISLAENKKLSSISLTHSLMAITAALAATVVGVALWTTRDGSPNSSRWAELDLRVDRANALQEFSTIPQIRFVSLGRHVPEVPVEGYIVQDAIAKQWHVHVFHMPAIPKGRVYQLWFDMGDSRFERARIADVDEDGTLSCLVDVPSDLVAIRGLVISDEPGADSERPTVDNIVEAMLP